MAGKYKTTGCFKFMLFLLFFVPIVYFGSAYYYGEDGIGKIKDLIGIDPKEASNDNANNSNDTYHVDSQKKIEELENRIKELEAELYRKTQEIEKLQSIRDSN